MRLALWLRTGFSRGFLSFWREGRVFQTVVTFGRNVSIVFLLVPLLLDLPLSLVAPKSY